MVVIQHGSGDHFKHIYHRVVVVHTFDPSAQKAKAGEFLEFQDSLAAQRNCVWRETRKQHANIFDHTCFQGGLPQSSAPNSSVAEHAFIYLSILFSLILLQ